MSRDIDDIDDEVPPLPPRVPLMVATAIITNTSITFDGGGCTIDMGYGLVLHVDAEGEVQVCGQVALLRDLVAALCRSWSIVEASVHGGMDLTATQRALLMDVIGGSD